LRISAPGDRFSKIDVDRTGRGRKDTKHSPKLARSGNREHYGRECANLCLTQRVFAYELKKQRRQHQMNEM